ncbi:dipeptide/oligopeptide/nickel ABC transporter ATP-binding protein [Bradyrhizobium sp. AC87j1]|uniref:ABC transporter ATP-binding protein n=1 Tax=Bradyrhizobium sp. AC87j1 TaxID=2055894 RepID=UPI000CEBA494|nr:ABC transporter ATP-binding protein [Bradyrhizobium sp. AC87j1]PPQ14398.1 dipeptide/oligopeptide/nickel ABC transporter ATP-binding protein [Bradyrhizobium sp. AC87j1]
MTDVVLAARDLRVAFRRGRDWAEVVRGIDLSVAAGETLAIVGKSGCGKSVTALSLVGLLPVTARIVAGSTELLGRPLSGLPEREARALRGNRISIIFQDPSSALNPVLTIGEHLNDAILAHRDIGRSAARAEASTLLAQVRLPAPAYMLDVYPHQLFGGMRQRVLIAMAIANQPDVLIADEPTTALDATVQHEIRLLLRDIQVRTGMAMLLITHDLELVAQWADRVLVMYAGTRVEERDASSIPHSLLHPYSRALVESRPQRRSANGHRQRLRELAGAPPELGAAHQGCAFASRCSEVRARCADDSPPVIELQDGAVACHVVAERRAETDGRVS